ncbi:MAG: hypothetical protein V9H26_24345 [Verrucomicrobiota bacterium]
MRYAISALSLASGFVVSCSVHDGSFDEVARVPNPSHQVDAVLVESNGGATTSFGYHVHLVPSGSLVTRLDSEVASFYAAIRSESAYGVDLKWDANNQLVCEYLSAKQANIVKGAVVVNGGQITVALRSNITNNVAAPGGMLYNLKKGS